MSKLFRIGVLSLVVVAVVGCDQSSKLIARSCLQDEAPVELVRGVVRLSVIENTGAFLSLGAEMPEAARAVLFGFAVGGGLAAGLVYLVFAAGLGRSSLVAGALVIAGGLGNLIDRVLRSGAVTDFITIGLGRWRTGVFNLADVAIVAGVAALVVLGSRVRSSEAKTGS